ncbi:hypothetical protein D3C75_867380 [compost metagenome]
MSDETRGIDNQVFHPSFTQTRNRFVQLVQWNRHQLKIIGLTPIPPIFQAGQRVGVEQYRVVATFNEVDAYVGSGCGLAYAAFAVRNCNDLHDGSSI